MALSSSITVGHAYIARARCPFRCVRHAGRGYQWGYHFNIRARARVKTTA
jgi:hypothetical protein